MELKTTAGLAVAVICACTMVGCGDGRAPFSLAAPSALSSSQTSPGSRARVGNPQRADNDYDGYEDPEPGPDTGAMPAPATTPSPEQIPPADGAAIPVQLTVNITGLFGPASFTPNPLPAAVGNTVVWMNSDFINHDIVLDDGTPVGNLAPGQSSAPLSLAVPNVGYHCTIHPSMVGQIAVPVVGTDPAQLPAPDPSGYYPPPAADPYADPSGDDGYDDYDY